MSGPISARCQGALGHGVEAKGLVLVEETVEPGDRLQVARIEELRVFAGRQLMTEILSGDEVVSVAGVDAGEAEMEEHRQSAGLPVGVRLVPQWAPGLAVGVLPGRTGTSSRSSRARCIRCGRITCVPRWVCRRTRARWKVSGRS